MRPDVGAFLISVFFISGASFAASGLHLSVFLIGPAISFIIYILFRRKIRLSLPFSLILSICLILGAFYFHLRDIQSGFSDREVFKENVFINSFPEKGRGSVIYGAETPDGELVDIRARPYPSFRYGDILMIDGKISLTKNGTPTVIFPEITIVGEGAGSPIIAAVFKLRERLTAGLKSSLSPRSSALASGILLGDKSGFSDDMWDDFRETGTTHIVALSGFNIAVVIWAVGLLVAGFSRRFRSACVLITVSLFVIMAGAESSAVRAAIMGSLMLMGRDIGRSTGMRNVIALSALLMVVWDPSVVIMDIGFELSFLAVIGIIYLAPFIRGLIGLTEEASLGGVLVDTVSAQVMVLPILLLRFGSVSWYSVIVNLVVVGTVPLAMTLSLFTAVFGSVPGSISVIVGSLADVVLRYELETIHLFAVVF
ncbi:MAG: ComEC/Rec2 family competence protein [Candidatus Colwellbacteria bacterium]|nr:ComEC/Rec2 family competence protein [Candidatus Colwellbacteria bacterium]